MATDREKFFSMPGAKAGSGTPRTVQRGTGPVSPNYRAASNNGYSGQINSLMSTMLDERNLSRNVGKGFTSSERGARIGSRRIQAQNRAAKLLAGLGKEEMSQSGQLARTGMRQSSANARQADSFSQQNSIFDKNRANTLADMGTKRKNTLADMGTNRRQSLQDRFSKSLGNNAYTQADKDKANMSMEKAYNARKPDSLDYDLAPAEWMKKNMPTSYGIANNAGSNQNTRSNYLQTLMNTGSDQSSNNANKFWKTAKGNYSNGKQPVERNNMQPVTPNAVDQTSQKWKNAVEDEDSGLTAAAREFRENANVDKLNEMQSVRNVHASTAVPSPMMSGRVQNPVATVAPAPDPWEANTMRGMGRGAVNLAKAGTIPARTVFNAVNPVSERNLGTMAWQAWRDKRAKDVADQKAWAAGLHK